MYESVSIKGTKNGLVILIDENLDRKSLIHDFEKKMQQAHGFFKGATFAITTRSGDLLDNETVEKIELICRQHGLIPREEQIIWQKTQKLEDSRERPSKKIEEIDIPSQRVEYLKGTLRSGCRIVCDGDIVLLGDINPNAELIASGNICVFGTIKGVVHAGATGNSEAIIIAYSFQPQQLRIAHVFTRTPEQEEKIIPAPTRIIPEIAYIYNNNILIEKYKDYSSRKK